MQKKQEKKRSKHKKKEPMWFLLVEASPVGTAKFRQAVKHSETPAKRRINHFFCRNGLRIKKMCIFAARFKKQM